MRNWFVILLLSLLALPAGAMGESGSLKGEDPLEPRLKAVAQQLRCPVCQGETIYDSHSTVARQMKSAIREKLAEGKSDQEIVAFFVERYGNFVLMEPDREGANIILWLLPGLALVLGSVVAMAMLRRRNKPHTMASTGSVNSDDLIRRIERLQP